jgi:hypothetical protein
VRKRATSKRLFDKCCGDGTSEYKALLNWRNTPTTGMTTSPSQRLMGRRCRTFLPTVDGLLQPAYDAEEARREMIGQRAVQRHYYNRTAHALTPLKSGDSVRMRLPGSAQWTPGTVRRMVAPRSYEVEVDGTVYRRNRRQLQASTERVLPPVDLAEPMTSGVTRTRPRIDVPTLKSSVLHDSFAEDLAEAGASNDNSHAMPCAPPPLAADRSEAEKDTTPDSRPVRSRRQPSYLSDYDVSV